MPYIKVRGFAPDAEPNAEGILVEANNLVPTLNGMEALPGDVSVGVDTAPSAVRAITTLLKLDDTARTIAGSDNALYEVSTSAWNNVSQVSSGTTLSYSMTANGRWTFAQYGDRSIAAQKGTQIQESTSGDFADMTTAPQAAFVTVVLDFVLAFNTNDATYGDSPDRWRCCAVGNPDSWTPNVATQAATGRLLDEPGAIRGAQTLGSNVVVYKDRSMFLGEYVGPPDVFRFRRVVGHGLGAPSHYAIVGLESAQVFMAQDNFWLFDGTRPVAIGTNRVADFVFDDLDWANRNLVVGFHDTQNWRVFWWYPSLSSGGTLDKYVCYNYRSDKWGFGEKTVAFAWEYFSTGMAYDDVGTFFATYDAIPTTGTYDDLFGTTGLPQPATVDVSANLSTMTGVGADSSLVSGDIGVDGSIQVLQRVRPRFKTVPTTGTQAHRFRDQLGGTATTSVATTTLTDGAFDHVFAARWHSLRQAYTGSMELLGWDVTIVPDSQE